MIPQDTLAHLHQSQQLLSDLLEAVPDTDGRRAFDAALPPLDWLFARAVYLELYWLREVVMGDADLAGRVRHLLGDEVADPLAAAMALPPRDHLLNWALEIFDHDLTRLANPAGLPPHPLLEDGWILVYLTQRFSLLYEEMVQSLVARQLATGAPGYAVNLPLVPRLPAADAVRVEQGHYRIGAREGVVLDNEQPPMSVELHSFRIQKAPVTNAELLAFLVDGGYENAIWWSEAGDRWRRREIPGHPWHWRRDAGGRWFGFGVNGPADLVAEDPVHGVNRYEAEAFANWAAEHGEDLDGAVLQHELQWEVAARGGHLKEAGRVWEWCANLLEPYDAYEPPTHAALATRAFDAGHYALRGAALHTRPPIRRVSFRGHAPAQDRHRMAGIRLVLPGAQ